MSFISEILIVNFKFILKTEWLPPQRRPTSIQRKRATKKRVHLGDCILSGFWGQLSLGVANYSTRPLAH